MTALTARLHALRPLGAHATAALPRAVRHAHGMQGASRFRAKLPVAAGGACSRRCQLHAGRLRCMARGGADDRDEVTSRPFFSDEVLRSALLLDAAGEPVPATFLQCKRLERLLRHHTLLQRAPAGDADALHVAASVDAAGAQQRMLRVLAALEAACPAVLRGEAGNASIPTQLQKKHGSQKHCFRRLGTLAAFAEAVPESAWAQLPETWQPDADKRCVAFDLSRHFVHFLLMRVHVRRPPAQLRSFIRHMVCARFEIPPCLFRTFERWRWRDHQDLRTAFAHIFLDVARGGSLRRD
jgi:hypothetical protein